MRSRTRGRRVNRAVKLRVRPRQVARRPGGGVNVSRASAWFKACVHAMANGELIEREGKSDKEFHFQNWFRKRLEGLGLNFDSPGRNTYPDFRLVQVTEGYELKGLAYP